LTSLYTISREDIYDYRRCPKIVAIKANRALKTTPKPEPVQVRQIEPAVVGKIGEAAVKLGFQGVPRAEAMERISAAIPETDVGAYLKQIALEALKGVEEIRRQLSEEYRELSIIGRGEGRHPDLAGRVRPDFVAYSKGNDLPVIVESKNSTKPIPADNFQALLYNGIAEKFGIYLLEEHIENNSADLRPRLVEGKAEAILVYPRLAKHFVVKETFVPDLQMIKGIWRAKELGFNGKVPETNCGNKCPHTRLNVKLQEEDMEPLAPLPLIFSEGLQESGFNLDVGYQASYAWGLLPQKVRTAVSLSFIKPVKGLGELKDWLTGKVGLSEEAAGILVDPSRRDSFLAARPDGDKLVKSMASELEPWKGILKERVESNVPSILALATAVYSLPRGSARFVKDAWDRWH
jgi:hypothetical protein